MKLLIGIPTLDYVNSEFMKCLINLVIRLKNDGIQFEVDIESGTLVYMARERIAKKAVNENFTHVLWLDSDMVFNSDILDDLMFSGKDFVTGIYQARRKGYGSVIFKSIDLQHVERFEQYPTETFEIEGCGFGCVLTATHILKAVLLNKETCFTPILQYGEDIAFCFRCRELGYKMYCEPSVVCGHIGHITIYPEDHERWKDTISNYNEVEKWWTTL